MILVAFYVVGFDDGYEGCVQGFDAVVYFGNCAEASIVALSCLCLFESSEVV